MNPDFNLVEEVSDIKASLKILLERTQDLPALRETVARNDTELGMIRKVGYFFGLGLVTLIVDFFRNHWGGAR